MHPGKIMQAEKVIFLYLKSVCVWCDCVFVTTVKEKGRTK